MANKIAIPGGKTDVMTAEQRSRCMSKVKGKDTGPEMMLRKVLWAKGWRYRIKSSILGRPDIIFPGKHIAIFVDGCFWHGCPLHGTRPKSNRKFWMDKIEGNIKRDKKVTDKLKKSGWTVIRIWEHEIKDGLDLAVEQVEKALSKAPNNNSPHLFLY